MSEKRLIKLKKQNKHVISTDIYCRNSYDRRQVHLLAESFGLWHETVHSRTQRDCFLSQDSKDRIKDILEREDNCKFSPEWDYYQRELRRAYSQTETRPATFVRVTNICALLLAHTSKDCSFVILQFC